MGTNVSRYPQPGSHTGSVIAHLTEAGTATERLAPDSNRIEYSGSVPAPAAPKASVREVTAPVHTYCTPGASVFETAVPPTATAGVSPALCQACQPPEYPR